MPEAMQHSANLHHFRYENKFGEKFSSVSGESVFFKVFRLITE